MLLAGTMHRADLDVFLAFRWSMSQMAHGRLPWAVSRRTRQRKGPAVAGREDSWTGPTCWLIRRPPMRPH